MSRSARDRSAKPRGAHLAQIHVDFIGLIKGVENKGEKRIKIQSSLLNTSKIP